MKTHGAVSAAAAEQEPGVQDVASSVLSAQCRLWLCWVDTAALQWQEPAEHSLSQRAPHHPLLGVLWVSLHTGGEMTRSCEQRLCPAVPQAPLQQECSLCLPPPES